MAMCKRCRAPIFWVETEATAKKPARKMPLDAENSGEPKVVPESNIVLTGQSTGDGTPIVRYVPNGRGNRVSHFATCPEAAKFRKSQKASR